MSGLGYYILRVKESYMLDKVFACVVVIVILSLLMNGLVRFVSVYLPAVSAQGERMKKMKKLLVCLLALLLAFSAAAFAEEKLEDVTVHSRLCAQHQPQPACTWPSTRAGTKKRA